MKNKCIAMQVARPKVTGFTLAELMIAVSIAAIVMAGVSITFMQSMRVYHQEQVYNELSYNLEIATEHIRRDLRLSSVGVGLMTFFPKEAEFYTAISMPKALDISGDGLLDRDAEGKLLWRQTVIYHVEPGSPDKLIRTTFSPRHTSATPTEVYDQLAAVAVATTPADYQAACLPGESVTAQQIFANLVDIKFLPSQMRYDTYAPASEHGGTYNWGSVVIDPGMHQVTFNVVGKNAASSGHTLGIDRFHLSRSASWREAEMFTPIHSRPADPHYRHTVSNGSVAATLMGSTWAWRGNSELTYSGVGDSSSITFDVYNDLWHETAFDTPGWSGSNVVVHFDDHFASSPPYIPEWVVAPDKGITWEPSGLETNLMLASTDFIAVTNWLYGSVDTNNAALQKNGHWARFEFQREINSALVVTNARVIDVTLGITAPITFNGLAGVALEVTDPVRVWSDWVPMWETRKTDIYQVSFDAASLAPENLYDILIGKHTEGLALYLNDGTDTVPDFSNATSVNPYGDPALMTGGAGFPKFADINGNGLLDLFIGRQDGRITHYRNDGTKALPKWTWMTDQFANISLGADAYAIPAFADIDGDGKLDLFVGSADGQLRFYQNIGTPQAPDWAIADVAWQGIEPGYRHAPEFVDINNNGKLDLFIGVQKDDGYVMFYRNDGTASTPAMTLVVATGWNNYSIPSAARFPYPAFADMYGHNDGRVDLFLGEQDGKIKHFPHPGLGSFDDAAIVAWSAVAPASTAWQAIDVGNPGGGKPHGYYASPAFGKIHAHSSTLVAWQEDVTTNAPSMWASVDGVATNAHIVLSAVEVGYPKISLFRSGVFDTRMDAPEYDRLSWTQIENWPAGDIDIRVRSSHAPDMTGAEWTDARAANDGYFQVNQNNNLAGLPRRRYVQFEAVLGINAEPGHPRPQAHTNSRPDAILRDVTIHWPGAVGLVDLVTEFGHRPDGAIVEANVNGYKPVKGIGVEMEIFKQSRTGMQSVRGVLEVRPLNTGK